MKMNIWIHTAVAATALAATIVVAVASVATYDAANPSAAKADRLPIANQAASNSQHYVTIEQRGDHLSVLTRVPVTSVASN
jgi:hypothetical protein